MKLRLNHVSMRVTDLDLARRFYTGILGLQPHPQKTNWLGAGQGCLVHLMTPTLDNAGTATPTDPARHGPYGAPESALWKTLPCSFCYRRFDETKACLLTIPPDEVAERAAGALTPRPPLPVRPILPPRARGRLT